MKKIIKFLNFLICLTVFISIYFYNPHKVFAYNPQKNNILSLSKGSYVVYESSSYNIGLEGKNLMDGIIKRGWRSKKNCAFPHIIIFSLAGSAYIDLLKFNNSVYETNYPGISAKEVKVEFSTVSSDSGYINVGTFTLEKGAWLQEFPINKTKVQWIRLSIKSNHGHPNYTELMEFEAWGVFKFNIFQILFNFIWILGAAVILADFSYHEFLGHIQKTKRTEFFKRGSFKKPFFLGLILVVLGISASIQQIWLAVIFGAVTFLLIISFIKFTKIQASKKQEDRD